MRTIKIHFLLFPLSFLFIFSVLQIHAQTTPQYQPVQITYIANEGVLISSGQQQVLLDAIHKEYYPDYMATDEKILASMFAGEKPFDSVDLVLVSHVHRDHFHAATIADYLTKQKQIQLFTTPQVADSVEEVLNKTAVAKERIVRGQYASGMRSGYEYENIKVSLFKIAHGSDRWPWIENVGHLIELSGKKILHVGDPSFGEADIRELNLGEDKIDVAILPYWFLIDEKGREVIDKLIAPKNIIACHIPPARAQMAAEELPKIYEDVIVFTEPMTSVTFD